MVEIHSYTFLIHMTFSSRYHQNDFCSPTLRIAVQLQLSEEEGWSVPRAPAGSSVWGFHSHCCLHLYCCLRCLSSAGRAKTRCHCSLSYWGMTADTVQLRYHCACDEHARCIIISGLSVCTGCYVQKAAVPLIGFLCCPLCCPPSSLVLYALPWEWEDNEMRSPKLVGRSWLPRCCLKSKTTCLAIMCFLSHMSLQ